MEQQENPNSSEVKQEVKTYSAEQFNGLLADKQTEVRKRQEAEKPKQDKDPNTPAPAAEPPR